MALPPQHAPQEWLNSGARAVTTRIPPDCSSPSAQAWVQSAASPYSTAPLTSSPTFPTTRIGPCAYATISTGTHRDFQSHHSIDELKRWFADEGFTDIVELAPAKNGRLYTWAYEHNLIIGSGVNVVGRKQ